jgi:hypothetical protein
VADSAVSRWSDRAQDFESPPPPGLSDRQRGTGRERGLWRAFRWPRFHLHAGYSVTLGRDHCTWGQGRLVDRGILPVPRCRIGDPRGVARFIDSFVKVVVVTHQRHQDDPNHYRKLEDFPVQHAVHSLAVDLSTHRVYTPEQEEDPDRV